MRCVFISRSRQCIRFYVFVCMCFCCLRRNKLTSVYVPPHESSFWTSKGKYETSHNPLPAPLSVLISHHPSLPALPTSWSSQNGRECATEVGRSKDRALPRLRAQGVENTPSSSSSSSSSSFIRIKIKTCRTQGLHSKQH